MKKCSKCGEEKALEAFYFDKRRPRARCKECEKKRIYAKRNEDRDAFKAKRRNYYAENTERVLSGQRKRWAENADAINASRRAQRAEDPAPFREAQRKSYLRHQERLLKEKRAAYAENPEPFLEAARRWRERHPEDARNSQRRSRAKRPEHYRQHNREYYAQNKELWEKHRRKREARLAGVEWQPYTRREIYDRDRGRCCECEEELPFAPRAFQIDHIVPISLEGPDIPANVQLLCPPCNRAKWATLEGQIHLPV